MAPAQGTPGSGSRENPEAADTELMSTYSRFNRDALAFLTASYDDDFKSIHDDLLERVWDEAAGLADDGVRGLGQQFVATANLFASMLYIARTLLDELAEAKNMSFTELIQNLARTVDAAPGTQSTTPAVSVTSDRDVMGALMNCYMVLTAEMHAQGRQIPLKLIDSHNR